MSARLQRLPAPPRHAGKLKEGSDLVAARSVLI
jgi:hypothetical protein